MPSRLSAASRLVHRSGGAGLAAALLLTAGVTTSTAQQIPYPAPRLASVFPPGGKAGSTVEVTVTGADLDDATALYFSTPGVKVERVPDPPPPKDKKKAPPPQPTKFKVTIPATTPAGLHDVRVIGKWGVSNPRAFAVGTLPEVVEKEPNNDTPQAQRVDLGSVVNGVVGDKVDVDYFTFAGKAGQKVVLHCAASGIDSRLLAYLQVFDAAGQQLGSNKYYRDTDALLSLSLPADGDYFVRVCEFAYQNGGPESVYRLTLSTGPWVDAAFPPVLEPGKPNPVTLYGRNLPGGKPIPGNPAGLEELAVTITPPAPGADGAPHFPGRLLPRAGAIDGFAYRHGASNPVLIGYAEHPIVRDAGNNDTPETAQPVTVPADVCGRVEARGDRDFYTFTARKDEVVVIEGLGDRLRSPIDLFVRLKNADTGQVVGEYDDNPAMPPVVDRLFTYSDDPFARVVIPADGRYELLVGARDALGRGGPREVYCVRLRREAPDFQLVVVANHDSAAGLTLRRGSSQAVQVVCFRRDGFDGPVTLAAEGLPAGVTCDPQVLGPALYEGSLVLTAAPGAKDWAGAIRITGAAEMNGRKVVREARAGCLVFPTNNNVPAMSRLARSLCVAVRDPGPFRLTASEKDLAVPVGGSLAVKLKVDKQFPDFKDNVSIDLVAGPAQKTGKTITAPKVTVGPDKEGTVKLQVPNGSPAGTYTLVFRGTGKLTVEETGTKKKKNTEYVAVSPAIPVTVFDSAGELTIEPKAVALTPGTDTTVTVRVKRLHKYAGEFLLELVPPAGVQGIGAATVKVPPGATEANVVIKTDKNAKPAKDVAFRLRANARVENVSLKTEEEFRVTVGTLAAPGTPSGNVKATAVLPAGADGWKYSAAASGDGWVKPDFDDKTWRQVRAPLGNGEPEVATRKGTEVAEKGQTVYARRSFDLPSDLLEQKGVTFRLQVASDNSAVVYLNGKVLDEDTADHEFSYWNREVAIAADRLLPGKNVIAVRVNNTAGSSDLYFDLAVSADTPLPPKK